MNQRSLFGRLRRALRCAALAHAPGLWIRCATSDDRELGAWGEEIAARHLARAGWRLLGRRVRTPAAEIDIVARERAELVCVEVKTARATPEVWLSGTRPPELGSDPRWRPGARCDRRQLARLERAGRFLTRARNGRRGVERARIDLIEVWVDERRGHWRIVHHRALRRPIQ